MSTFENYNISIIKNGEGYRNVPYQDTANPTKEYLEKEIKILEVAEGFRDRPYLDTRGILTWGIGRNIQDYPLTGPERQYIVSTLGTGSAKDQWTTEQTCEILSKLNMSQAKNVAFYLVRQVLNELDSRWHAQTGWFAEVEDARKSAWLDLSYNCGLSAVMGWRESLKLMEDEQYEELADRLLGFPWAKQVHADKPSPTNPTGGRAYYITELIRTGEYADWMR